MALKDKTSLYDRHTYNTLGNTPENTSPSAGNYFTEQGASDSPFTSKAGGNDHMVKLLTKQVFSTNTGETYLPSPNGSEFQDLDGVSGPQFQLGREELSKIHIDSLKLVPGAPSNSPFQDRGDGGMPTQYLDGLPG